MVDKTTLRLAYEP